MSKSVNLALQGGGALGAFTWGVLDRLLEDGRLDIRGISGASAGAMNAVVLAHGYTCGGRDGARQALQDFWQGVGSKSPFQTMTKASAAKNGKATPALKALLFMTRFFSPYQLNPFDVNPLRDILASQVDFERLRADCSIELFIATTRVSSGASRLFRTRELTLDVLLASACLPTVHHSIDIDGEAYWDGGLTNNPPLLSLVEHCPADDMIMVLLHATASSEAPESVEDITHRLSQISFTAGFFAELQTIAQMKQVAEHEWMALGRMQRKLRRLNFHLIDSRDYMDRLAAHSSASTDLGFITALHEEGRSRASLWLERNFQRLGSGSSCRLEDVFQ